MERSTTYLLKVWRPAAGGFRAHLRAVDQESAVGFESAQALMEHLLLAARPPLPPGPHRPVTQTSSGSDDGAPAF